MGTETNAREISLLVLNEVEQKGEYLHVVLNKALTTYQYLHKHDRAFISRLTEGTIEYKIQLDFIIDCFSTVKTIKMKPVILNILRMGVYQLKYMDSVPASAACNEAVKLAVKKGFGGMKGFVNGVLRSISRNMESIEYPKASNNQVHYLQIQYSMPRWLVKHYLSMYEFSVVETICRAFLEDQETTVRTNCNKTTPAELVAELVAEGIEVKKDLRLPYAFKIRNYNTLMDIQAFREGRFIVQDVSSMLVTETADPKEGDTVIDVCAAPGGKAVHMAERLNGTGLIRAYDISQQKVEKIQENAERMGMKNIEIGIQDATVLDTKSCETADIVIADLPCSGLGVIGKKADIKYRRTEKDLKALAGLQWEILSTVQHYVKPGGILVYSTCTINHAENIDNVNRFVGEFDFTIENVTHILPGDFGSDGFFIARLKKGRLDKHA